MCKKLPKGNPIQTRVQGASYWGVTQKKKGRKGVKSEQGGEDQAGYVDPLMEGDRLVIEGPEKGIVEGGGRKTAGARVSW